MSLILHATTSTLGIFALALFGLAYLVVVLEEFIHIRKSKPVIMAAGIIWFLVAIIAKHNGQPELAQQAVRHNILEYAELFLFLLVAMTYVNSMQERRIFHALRIWLTNKGLTLRQLFWVTGLLAFFISPFADNLTTALIMCSVALAVGENNHKFISVACINIVIAANAGGAYSPFGDVTTLMVWQKGVLEAHDFFAIFIPAAISFLIPAVVMSLTVPNIKPTPIHEPIVIYPGGIGILFLFITTIVLTTLGYHTLKLPPAIGMMTGLGLLKIYGFYLRKRSGRLGNDSASSAGDHSSIVGSGIAGSNITGSAGSERAFESLEVMPAEFDIIKKIESLEWDTLLFFYGIILCVGGLATIGYLESLSNTIYHDLGTHMGAYLGAMHHATPANIIVGLLSAVVDNIPVMYAVLTMMPDMSHGQWLLVTLTTGIGGSLLSIGSAAGVALMGHSRGQYTFFSHLKWSWIILIGYAVGVWSHIVLNKALFVMPVS